MLGLTWVPVVQSYRYEPPDVLLFIVEKAILHGKIQLRAQLLELHNFPIDKLTVFLPNLKIADEDNLDDPL